MNWVLKEFLIFLAICLLLLLSPLWAQPGFVAVPVADLLGEPMNQRIYAHLPYCGAEPDPGAACPRIHQLLLHEPVEIIAQENQQVCIETPHLFYITTQKDIKPQNQFWTSKKNIKIMDRSAQAQLPHKGTHDWVALISPFYSAQTKEVYSAGTQFKIQSSTKNAVLVWAYNNKTNQFELVALPKKICLKPATAKSEQRKQFVRLCRFWAHQDFVPYVWGGTSFAEVKHEPFFLKKKGFGHKQITYFAFSKEPNQKTGFDCAGLINRAAQLCGIPFYFKNTTTIAHYLKPIHNKNDLQEGDIIWIAGHVMIIGSLEDHTLIEARGFTHGFGKVQEISLEKVFKQVKTFDQLFAHQQKKLPFFRLNSEGKVVQTVRELKLLKLM